MRTNRGANREDVSKRRDGRSGIRDAQQDPKGTDMTNEERDMITQFIARVGGAPAGGQTEPVGRLGAGDDAARAAAGGSGGERADHARPSSATPRRRTA